MPRKPPTREAARAGAHASARTRRTSRLVRDLTQVPPLTAEQRDRIVAAAQAIPVLADAITTPTAAGGAA